MPIGLMKNLRDGIQSHIVAFIVKRLPKKVLAAEARREEFPNEPWLWEENVADGPIPPEPNNYVQTGWAFAFFFNAIAWLPVSTAYHLNHFTLHPWSRAILLLPLAGIMAIIWAIHRATQAKVLSESTLCLNTFPVASGTSLVGSINVPVPVRLFDEIELTLTCHEAISTESGNPKNTITHTLWTNTKSQSGVRDILAPSSKIPVEFALPHDMEGTFPPDSLYSFSARKIYWTLMITVAIRGSKLRALYKVPIYQTVESPPVPPPEYNYLTWQYLVPKLLPAGIYYTRLSKGRHILRTRVPRNYSTAVPAAAALLVFAYAASQIPTFRSRELSGNGIMGIIVLSLLAGGIQSLLYAVRIEISTDGIALKSGMLGFRRTCTYTPEEIASLDSSYKDENSLGNPCNVQLHTIRGQKIVLLQGLPNPTVAQELIAAIFKTLEPQLKSTVDNT